MKNCYITYIFISAMTYNDQNIFAKILRVKFPAIKSMKMILFYLFMILIHKKIHALIIPKGKYVDLDDFSQNASPEEMVGLLKGINKVAKKLGISVDNGKGYRALVNISDHGGQEVPHLHFHLFGGKKLVKWFRDSKVERKYLEINSIKNLSSKLNTNIEVSLKLIDPPDFNLNKFFYKQVGKNIDGLID